MSGRQTGRTSCVAIVTAGSPEGRRLSTIADGDSLVLDTSVLISYLKGDEASSTAAGNVIDGLVATGRNPAVISAITVAELMVRPLRDLGLVPTPLNTFLLGFPGLTIRSADFLIAAEAARIRAQTAASLPDSLVAATATLTSSSWLVSNDQVLRDRLSGFAWETKVLLLSELTAPGA